LAGQLEARWDAAAVNIGSRIAICPRKKLATWFNLSEASSSLRPLQSIAITSRPPETILPVLASEWVNNKKSPSARWLSLSLGNQDFQFAKGRETRSTTPLKFRPQ
jgi:hypothetical protein